MSEEHETWMHCYECRRHGDHIMYDGEGNQMSACTDCWFNDAVEYPGGRNDN